MPGFLDALIPQTPSALALTPEQQTQMDAMAADYRQKHPFAARLQDLLNSAVEGVSGAVGIPGPDTHARRGGEVLNAIMPIASPLRSPAIRANILARLTGRAAYNVGPEAEAAIQQFAQRYPRLLSHVSDVTAPANESFAGALVPESLFGEEARGRLQIRKGMTPEQTEGTVAHEITHLADHIRTADRLRHADTSTLPEGTSDPGRFFIDLYNTTNEQTGYRNNPFEIRARVGEETHMLPRDLPGRQQIGETLGTDALHQQTKTAEKLGRGMLAESMRAKRRSLTAAGADLPTTPASESLGDLLRRLRPDLFGGSEP